MEDPLPNRLQQSSVWNHQVFHYFSIGILEMNLIIASWATRYNNFQSSQYEVLIEVCDPW